MDNDGRNLRNDKGESIMDQIFVNENTIYFCIDDSLYVFEMDDTEDVEAFVSFITKSVVLPTPKWEKLTEVEPGLYWCGGLSERPSGSPYVTCFKTGSVGAPAWYARICDVPPLPEMPRPDLKIDDPVLVRDNADGKWLKKHFAGWSDDGRMQTWPYGGTSWSNEEELVPHKWDHWKIED
jgi:hypothetical protein